MSATGRVRLGNLPAELTSFVGRGSELAGLKRLLADARLVTLTGVGGTGKTRLALRLAAEVRRAFPDGVWFVDLTELHDPGLLTHEVYDPEVLAYLVAAALGLHDRSGGSAVLRLTDHLRDRQTLLVLDNCEHLLPACAVLVDQLLRACRRVRILATSREPLAVRGEQSFAVPPLSAPAPDERPDLARDRYEAVALFVARAQAIQPDFSLTEDNRAAVADICHRLDGLPLAIELAAARVRVLAPQHILDRLADRFAVLNRGSRTAPARQRTLRACMDWSLELCSKPERILWARLSVFVGGFELDAVERVCADEQLPKADLLDLVTDLVDKSIVVRDDVGDDHGEAARYRMLETIRNFGQEQLVEAGDDSVLRRRHRDWYRQLVDYAAAEWISERQEHWSVRLSREHPNLRAAIEYCLAEPGQTEAALHFAVTAPLSHWFNRGNLSEVRRWLDRALAQASPVSAVRAGALLLNAHLAIIQGNEDTGLALLKEGERLARQAGATVELAVAAYDWGVAWLYQGNLPAAIEAFERVGTILSTVARPESGLELRLIQLIALGTASGLAGQHDRADACLREALAISEPRGERHHQSYALAARALSAWRHGEIGEAETSLAASLRLKQVRGWTDVFGAARCIEVMAWVAAGKRQYRRAATLLGAADALWTKMGTRVTKFGHLIDHHEECERQTRAAVGDAAFTDAFSRGQALPYDDAITYALDEEREFAPAAGGPGPLTRRERQVADLIAQGMSNKDIAAALVISQRTAESHVEHILTKLGFTARAQVAAWIARQQSGAQHV